MKWITVMVLALVGCAATVSAQTAVPNAWSRGTTLAIFGGTAAASPNTTGTFGAAMGWELNHRAEIEGVAAWLVQRHGAKAFAADLKLLINLTRPSRIVPYVGGGAGLYQGSFATPRTEMPHFYQRRIATDGARTPMTFTDPTAIVAGGAHLYVGRHLSIRPEAAVRFVTDDARAYRVTTVTFSLVYHVEEHAVR